MSGSGGAGSGPGGDGGTGPGRLLASLLMPRSDQMTLVLTHPTNDPDPVTNPQPKPPPNGNAPSRRTTGGGGTRRKDLHVPGTGYGSRTGQR